MSRDDRDVEAVAASEPWAFTQQHPLTTSDFCKEADRRGIKVSEGLLRELWRVGALAPIAEVRNRAVGPGRPSPIKEPYPGGTWATEVRQARDRGRLADPMALGFRSQLKFENPTADIKSPWWNGLVYSRWQLIALDRFKSRLVGLQPACTASLAFWLRSRPDICRRSSVPGST